MQVLMHLPRNPRNPDLVALRQAYDAWATRPSGGPNPSFGGLFVGRDEYGVGLKLDHLPASVPPLFRKEGFIKISFSEQQVGVGLIDGTYYCMGAEAVVRRYSSGRHDDPTTTWHIHVVGEFHSALRLYGKILNKTARPVRYWTPQSNGRRQEQILVTSENIGSAVGLAAGLAGGLCRGLSRLAVAKWQDSRRTF